MIIINSIQRFLTELEKIKSKFKWSFQEKIYRDGELILDQIIGDKDGKEYIPLTAVVEEAIGKYYEPSFFDKAAGDVYMSAQLAMQIIDSCDDWPDRLHDYKPKNYEIKLRKEIIKILFGE